MAKISLSQVRYWPGPVQYSRQVGYKGKLLSPKVARAIVKRLKRFGVKAFVIPFRIKAGEKV